jgi:hypothetical protein
VARTGNKIGIWNRALFRVGESGSKVEAETDTSIAAEACLLVYDDCLEQTLESFDWPFATKQIALSEPAGVSRTGWEYVYTLPADCVRPIALLAEDQRMGLLTKDMRFPFAIFVDDADEKQYLCADVDIAEEDFEVLEYIALIEYVPAYPRRFVSALSWLLASELALSLKKDTKLSITCLQAYDLEITKAQADALNREKPDPKQTTPSVAARS